MSEAQRERLAAHEAGHVVVAHLLGRRIDRRSIAHGQAMEELTDSNLERALRHFDKLIENGLLDAIDKRLEEYELSETEIAVVTQHAGQEVYLPPDSEELESDYADAFTYAVAELHRRLWPLELP